MNYAQLFAQSNPVLCPVMEWCSTTFTGVNDTPLHFDNAKYAHNARELIESAADKEFKSIGFTTIHQIALCLVDSANCEISIHQV